MREQSCINKDNIDINATSSGSCDQVWRNKQTCRIFQHDVVQREGLGSSVSMSRSCPRVATPHAEYGICISFREFQRVAVSQCAL